VERAGFRRISRPIVIAAAGRVATAKKAIANALRRGENGTQQYFRKH
jgi:hypothetical protein